MEQTGVDAKEIREVEFRERMRGYHQDDVDQFLERVALGVEFLESQLAEAQEEIAMLRSRPPQVVTEMATPTSINPPDDIIQRTLLLAQTTADNLEREAKARAHEVVLQAQAEAERLKDETHGLIRRIEAEQRARLEAEQRESARQVAATKALLVELTSRVREVQDKIRSQLTGVLAMVATIDTPDVPADLSSSEVGPKSEEENELVTADFADPFADGQVQLDPFATANEISDSEALSFDVAEFEETAVEAIEVETEAEPGASAEGATADEWGGLQAGGGLDLGTEPLSRLEEDEPPVVPNFFEAMGASDDDSERAIPSIEFGVDPEPQTVQEFVFGQELAEDGDDGGPFLLWRDEKE